MATSLANDVEAMSLDDPIENRENFTLGNTEDFLNLSLKPVGDKDKVEQFYKERLNYVLKVAEDERNDVTFGRKCFLCADFFQGRSKIFDHLFQRHNFIVGYPEDIVFGAEFIDVLTSRIETNECFYCEKIFKHWDALKSHLRKRHHRRINPKHTKYDKFYIANYLKPGQTWRDFKGEKRVPEEDFHDFHDSTDVTLSEEEMESQENMPCCCLFCAQTFDEMDECFDHMLNEHNFDYNHQVTLHQLDYYKQIKMVNYFRYSTHHKKCPNCLETFENMANFVAHYKESGHSKDLPDKAHWDQPMFFFPTLEDDRFLCSLNDDIGDDTDESLVIPEDMKAPTFPTLTWEEIAQMRA